MNNRNTPVHNNLYTLFSIKPQLYNSMISHKLAILFYSSSVPNFTTKVKIYVTRYNDKFNVPIFGSW